MELGRSTSITGKGEGQLERYVDSRILENVSNSSMELGFMINIQTVMSCMGENPKGLVRLRKPDILVLELSI